MHRYFLELLLKFLLAQITLLIVYWQFERTFEYIGSDFQYSPFGPYMLRSSRVPPHIICQQFYDPDQDFVQVFGKKYTHQQYMKKVTSLTLYHGQSIQAAIMSTTLVISVLIQILGFISDNQLIFILDNLFTMILPHFTLLINTISWGDQCIGQSPILNVIDFTVIGYIGFLTIGSLILLIFAFICLQAVQFSSNNPLYFIFGCLISLILIYVLVIDIISLYSSPKIVMLLLMTKFIITGLLLANLYDII